MSYQFNISEIGLRLIKAYEGYAPEGRVTRDGRKVIGYGRLTTDQDLSLTQGEAEDLLKADLVDIEDLINTNVHAAMTQSQFDALCSLAYSIGTDAFLSSDVLHALNKGEVIAAANGFDGWRLGNIGGQVYMVDALVRRRTAEKTLFLRPSKRTAPAPHDLLRALPDDRKSPEFVSKLSAVETVDQKPSAKVVPLYQGGVAKLETEEVFELTDEIRTDVLDDTKDDLTTTELAIEDEGYKSPIAEAAAEVSGRLDALMEQPKETNTDDWPDSLIEGEPEPLDFETTNFETTQLDDDTAITETYDNVVEGDFQRRTPDDVSDMDYDSSEKYIEPAEASTQNQNLWTFITMMVLGVSAAAGGLWANMRPSTYFGELSPLVWSAAVAIGVLLALMGLYYLLKHLFGKH